MVDITCIRGNGTHVMDDIVDPLISTISAALHRGRVELDEAELTDEITIEIPLTNVLLGNILYIEDSFLQSYKGKIIGIQHHAEINDEGNLTATTTISMKVLRNAST